MGQRGLGIPGSRIEAPTTYQWKPIPFFGCFSILCKTNHQLLEGSLTVRTLKSLSILWSLPELMEKGPGGQETDISDHSVAALKSIPSYAVSTQTGSCFPQESSAPYEPAHGPGAFVAHDDWSEYPAADTLMSEAIWKMRQK